MNISGLVLLIMLIPIVGFCTVKEHYFITGILVLMMLLLLKVTTQKGDEEDPDIDPEDVH